MVNIQETPLMGGSMAHTSAVEHPISIVGRSLPCPISLAISNLHNAPLLFEWVMLVSTSMVHSNMVGASLLHSVPAQGEPRQRRPPPTLTGSWPCSRAGL
jgi:hypothetical protein